MTRPLIHASRLLTPLCALLIVNAGPLYSKLSKGFFTLTAGWDLLAVILSGLCLLVLVVACLGVAIFYVGVRLVSDRFYLMFAVSLALDFYYFERPLTVFFAAVIFVIRLYPSSSATTSIWFLVGLLIVPALAVIGYDTPIRFVALGVGCLMFFVSLIYFVERRSLTFASFFQPPFELDLSIDCFLFLTIGGFAWSQSVELLGSPLGTFCYLPLAIVAPLPFSYVLNKSRTSELFKELPNSPRTITLQTSSNGAHLAPVLGTTGAPSNFLKAFPASAPTVFLSPSSPVSLKAFLSTPPPASKHTWNEICAFIAASPHIEDFGSGDTVQEAGHLFLGFANPAPKQPLRPGEPVLFDRQILSEHLHILGRSGSGKTSLGIMPIVTQLIRPYKIDSEVELPSDPEPIVLLDLKGDLALFNTVKHEAEARGQKFLFFTTEANRASYYFNPFAAFQDAMLGVSSVTQSLLDALNLNHGEGYGRSYFTRISRQRLLTVLTESGTPTSFQDLYQKLTQGLDKRQAEDAFELQAAIESFLVYPQLFTTPEQDRNQPETIINFDRVLEERQVVYFWLPAATESMAAKEIGKLALFNLFTAAKRRQDSYMPIRQVSLIIDEFQRLVGENLTIILEQARSYGIGAILSNQTAAQLRTSDGKDLWPLINGNTAATLHFGSKDLNELEMLSRLSGEMLVARQSRSRTRTQSTSTTKTISLFGDPVDTSINEGESESESSSETEVSVPVLSVGALQRVFSDPQQFLVSVQRNSGLTRFDGAFVVVKGIFSTDRATYFRRKSERWPDVPAVPQELVRDSKAEFSKTRPSKEMLDKIRLLTQGH